MSEKATGNIYLIAGTILILFALVHVFLVFTGKMPPIQLFNSSGISFDPTALMNAATPAGGQAPTQTVHRQELISADLLNETSNFFAELVLMGFVASAGQKLASIGTTLLRPISVKLKAKDGVEYEVDKK